jgi:hypothetical protein
MVVCAVASLLLAGCSRGMLELLVLMLLCGSRLLEDGEVVIPSESSKYCSKGEVTGM